MADTGEFIAISVANEEQKINAGHYARRASALSHALEATITTLHKNYHIDPDADADDDWRKCNYISCRNVKAVMDAGWDEPTPDIRPTY